VQCIWRREGLKVPAIAKTQAETVAGRRFVWAAEPQRATHVWSYDFASALTHDGRTLRILTLIDEYAPECLVS
jgi:putative transposase